LTIAIDDFGTGYSSLADLKSFPIDILKIDRTFICDIISYANDASITRAIITMANNLDLKVFANGVESEEQLRFLQQLYCYGHQGFYFSRPLSAKESEQLLEKSSSL